MSFEQRGPMPLTYEPVGYPGSVLRFRGPPASMAAPYILCLGGSETFGRFIPAPFTAQLAAKLPRGVVNMGVMNAGMDVLMQDAAIIAATRNAAAVVLQITGAQNLSNRLYGVHPRRNDRFVKTTAMLRTIYRDVDFTEFHFTRHLLSHLQGLSTERFGIVVAELRVAWMARMRGLLSEIDVPVHLLWLARHHPEDEGQSDTLGPDPLFITPDMLAEVRAMAASLSIIGPTDTQMAQSTRGMFFAPSEEAAARTLPGPDLHDRAAAALLPLLS
ncbi:DUF6473 family protein [Roseicyclus sp.]|uniref:DUF6473 family protein n=1 Tax=Roseicyclus sp. TaxID=1914329 RepID=UPI003F6B0C67